MTPLLTAEQLAAWSSFGPKWAAFKAAWLAKGLLWPPDGDPDDPPESSLRSRLWEVVDAWPTRVAAWIESAPGRSAYDVVGHVFGCYRAACDTIDRELDDMETRWEGAKSSERREASSFGEVFANMIRQAHP